MQLYLTLISVVQGVVAGYFASVVNDVYSSLSVRQWILIGATFLQIVAIWHSYAIAIVISAWIPTLADSIIPFTYGAAQLLVVGAVRSSEQSWVRAMAGSLHSRVRAGHECDGLVGVARVVAEGSGDVGVAGETQEADRQVA